MHPVSFASRRLTPAERNYSVHEREALAVVTFIKQFRCYLPSVPLRVLFTIDELHHILHDQLGHFAFDTVWKWIRQRYWRPHLYSEVRHFVASCSSCQRFALVSPRSTCCLEYSLVFH